MASLKHCLEGSTEGTSGGISYVFLCFIVFISCVFLLYFTVLLKQLRRLYTGGSIFKYHQCIIIAPIVIPRNFLCIFLFYSFISYVFLLYFTVLLKQLRRLYTGGFIFQVPPVSDYITWCTNAYLRVRYTSLLFTRSMHRPLLTRRCTNHLFTKL